MTADRLLLWRHGRTAFNAEDRFQGQLDIPLDDVGRVQVKDAAEMLAGRLHGDRFRIVSSDLRRAQDTALALSELTGVPVLTDPQLREIYVGRWEGLHRDEVHARDPELFAAWSAGDDIAVGGGERRSEAGSRAAEAIRRHVSETEAGVLVVASHGAALRGAVLSLTGIAGWSPAVIASLRNAHWAELRPRAGAWILEAYNAGPPRGSAGLDG